MINLQMPQGKNNAKKAAAYLLSDTDHTGKTRAVKPEILDGDPHLVAEISNNTTRAKKYVCGCLSFRDNEHPTPAQQKAVMDEFEQTFLPGLERNKNYAIAWVAHKDKGNLELNYFLAMTELTTGKQLNAFPPDSIYYDLNDAWVQNMNDKLGYQQVTKDPLTIYRSKFETKILPLKELGSEICKQATTHKQIRDDLEAVFKEAIVNGQITNKEQIIDELKKLGSITRTGQNYVSFIPTGEAKAIRLKGSMFKQDSDYKQLVNEFKSIGTKKQLSPDQAKKNEATIERLKKVRGDFFKSLYEPKQKQVRRFGPKKAQPKIKINVEQPRQEPLKEPAIKGTGQQSKPKQQNEEQPKQLEQQVLSKAPAAQDKKADSGKNSNPVISAFSKIATGVKADFFIIKINHLLSAQNALLLKIGSLNMFK
ncbi:MAG: relaxase/mobilization nuclease domain-containing protein, partial [Burkholderiales bacterium]|nr:relaxase/mobilization nuclease domain-containing protein [Burkholderiales bacterium]